MDESVSKINSFLDNLIEIKAMAKINVIYDEMSTIAGTDIVAYIVILWIVT